jgi:protein-L-isoaspartate(D-aspartate) O-methyltransferase
MNGELDIQGMNWKRLFLVLSVFFIAACISPGDVSPEMKSKINEAGETLVTTVYEEPSHLIDAREYMVERHLKGRDITNPVVLEIMGRLMRQEFVDESLRDSAYSDNPLPIGEGQTISQPYVVALMTQSLDLTGDEKVLEIGTGSGYQAAVLAESVKEVYTIEIREKLSSAAEKRFKRLGYNNIYVKNDDGYFGWEEHAPFDAIIITAAVNHVPPPLIAQLRDNGQLILPLGDVTYYQTLTLVEKQDGELSAIHITSVRFVPLVGEAQR